MNKSMLATLLSSIEVCKATMTNHASSVFGHAVAPFKVVNRALAEKVKAEKGGRNAPIRGNAKVLSAA